MKRNLFSFVYLATVLSLGLGLQGKKGKQKMLFNFAEGENGKSWQVVNDGVMGGLSSGVFQIEDQTGTLSGTLSLENNGGFSSVRSPVDTYKLGKYQGFVLRVRGDGRTWSMTLRDTPYFTGLAHNASFDTEAGSWQEIQIPFSDFEAKYFGRSARVEPIDPDEIRQMGVILADKKAGPFEIEIDWLKVY